MAVVDLSHPVASGMPVYPGDPEVTIVPALSVAEDGVAVARLDLGSHTGTHLDAPAHSVVGGRTVDSIPLGLLTGPARVLRVGPQPAVASEQLGIARIVGGLPAQLPEIVCIATGWDVHFGAPLGRTHPAISIALARELWERGARVLGVETLSPDPTDSADASPAMPVHEFWLGNDGVIVENLTGLAALPDEVEMALLPLRLAAGDGSPIRAVAFVD
ncbi:cyclase family protein [Leucobacter sp. NPDC058333]|uniref:cyclase family protein n=1 Tax=Leucobacter sp. NPDC058333 TaxID=3346450 RepID=UPI003661D784